MSKIQSKFFEVDTTTGLQFFDDDESNYLSLKAASAIPSNFTLRWPSADGTSGQALTTNGLGQLAFTTISGGANTFLSNLTSPTAINEDLLLTSTKTLRIPNNVYLKWRNAANTADETILRVGTSNEVLLRSSNSLSLYAEGGDWISYSSNEKFKFLNYNNVVPVEVWLESNTGFHVAIKPLSTLAADYTLTLPADDGTSGQVLTTDGSGVLSWMSSAFDFGDASDGAAVLDGVNTFSWASLTGSTYTLSRQAYLSDLTVNVGIIINTKAYSLFVKGTLSNAGVIDYPTTNGNNGVGAAGGAAADAPQTIFGNYAYDLAVGVSAPAGGNGSINSGGNGSPGFSSQPSVIETNGGGGGGGGAGDFGAGSSGGAVTINTVLIRFRKIVNTLLTSLAGGAFMLLPGNSGSSGGGGTGDGANSGGGGGGGGAGGNLMGLWVAILNNTGTIQANGGDGGDGAAGVAGNSGGGGGGGGGTGGFIYIITRTTIALGTRTATGGALGTGGAASGTGVAGANGAAGGAGLILHFQASTGTWL